ncbi:SpaA isopeptide-forming pilin-related protein [Finegoldia magna]|uniref:SpaA isopeptide-forming pilin-related protein n=1 Tax=Finegoldia magna TaxID=1260 RepID=UPI002903508E|nr:SpaA isopeptide-forming pilin-related protein [Finegoldia magna]MDU1580049.1 SpaA isopeptide-forming pilin-related protein [Finegoldia magna]MDU1600812.1 SpaA isopeptide-forming pilin-related protein [Finegoldia magna]
MRKILDRLTALVMVMLMVIQTITPAITSFAKEEELDKRYVIQKFETLKQDTYAHFSLNLATVIDDKNLDTDTNVKFTLNATSTNSNIKLLVRKDFSLYDERTFETIEDAHKEFDRVDKLLKDQGLSLDVSVVQEGDKYRIKNNYVPQAGKEDFGNDYKVYSLKVIPEFDFDKQGLFNKLPENDKLSAEHNLQLAEQRRLQQDGEVAEPDKHNRTYIFDFKVDKAVDSKLTTIALNKDENNPLEVKQNADLFAAILDDKTYSTYQTEQLPDEVTSSIEHKKEVAKAKSEADAKAKTEADAKAKKEADEKAKKEADEKAKKEAEEKAKADVKAKEEADKIKAEQDKKAQEQKTAEEKAKAEKEAKEKAEADAKAKAEADAKAKAEAEKLKAEAEAKQKAEAEEKAKQEQLAKEQAEAEAKRVAEEKAKKDLENKKLLGLEKDTEENQEEEPIIKKKETKEEVKSEPATPEERKQKAEEFDKALKDRKEEIKKSEDKKDANNKEDNKKTTDNKEVSKETKGLLEGIKEFFGFSNLQKADRELKAILSVKANGLKEVQALLSSFEEKYHLTKEEQAKLMDDNKDAIKALIEKDADKNFNPQMLFAQTRGANDLNLDGKKFTIITEYDISNKNGPVQKGQSFTIHLDDKLTVNDGSTLPSIKYNNEVIATPKYNSNNTITYTLTKNIDQNIQVPLNIPVDYNIGNITLDDDGTFTVINKVTGIGVNNPPKDLVPQKVDKNGNPAGSIIEPGRDDVTQIVDSSKNYRLDIDSVGNPVIENGEMVGINWVVEIESSKDLTKDLGMKMNFTLVEGSGLKEIKSITSSDSTEKIQDNDTIKGKTGIVDSKHSVINQSTKSYKYSIYTPISNKQAAYVLDISTVLTKDVTDGQPYVGAVRSVMDKGYPKDKVEQVTPTRVGINNRTTIEGKFLSNTQAQWTITDGVCTLDKNNGLPLETRTLEGANVKTGKRVVYGVDPTTGKMVVKEQEKGLTSIPAKEKEPEGTQAVGNIGVYQFTHDVDESTTPKSYTMSGVKISRYRDLPIDQHWNLPQGYEKMPAQDINVVDKSGNNLGSVHVNEENAKQRSFTVPNVKYWNINEKGEASFIDHKIKQTFPEKNVTIDNKQYKYNENTSYYNYNDKNHFILNSLMEIDNKKPATFKIVKVDSKTGKKLQGASFHLLGSGVSVVTDANGEATFTNIPPGTYTFTETKAPNGYKLDGENKKINISDDGNVSVSGKNVDFSQPAGKTEVVEHNNYPSWPDYMNAMHYGKVDANGNAEFYLYLKPIAPRQGGQTDRNTRLDISLPGVNITDVTAYDVSPGYRQTVKSAMEGQTAGTLNLGSNVINGSHKNKITGAPNTTDSYIGRTGYQIYFPKERFAGDWGFLVKVKANIGQNNSANLYYDWLTNEDTANQASIQKVVRLSKNTSGPDDKPTITIKNTPFEKKPIEIVKFADTFTDGKRDRLAGAEFVLKDSEGNPIKNVFTDKDGKASFGEHPEGKYTIYEVKAPDGYEKNGVYFEVEVNESKEVSYKARFENSSATPQPGQDYFIEKGKEIGAPSGNIVTSVNQWLDYNEGQAYSRGERPKVWEAYRYESLKYHADITLSSSGRGDRFEIQFDPNLDFTQYFNGFPKIKINGKEVADPYFNYETNLLTYVFNDKTDGGPATATIDLIGMIPSKYYAKNTGTYPFTITVQPNQTGISGQKYDKNIEAFFDSYDSGHNEPIQNYYFREIYEENGQYYVDVISYYNVIGDRNPYKKVGKKTLNYNWITTKFQGGNIANWTGEGTEPRQVLDRVKIYRTEANVRVINNETLINDYMPLSMGYNAEQNPNIYRPVFNASVDSNQNATISQNGITLIYDKNQINPNGKLIDNKNQPLKINMPGINNGEGYVIEQRFRIPDIDAFNNKWRAFVMNNGNLKSAFASGANKSFAKGDQTGGETPKYYKEDIGVINKKYTPGQFKIIKSNESDKSKLPGATFELTDANNKTIYRTSDNNGELSFTNLAPGKYTLKETKAPKDFIQSEKRWAVNVYSDGSVRITQIGILGSDESYFENNENIIIMPVSNKPSGADFRVYKKDSDGKPLQGAKFVIKNKDGTKVIKSGESNDNGVVEFKDLTQGTYIIEESEAPSGYNKLGKKWVLVIGADGSKKVYNYREKTTGTSLNSILEQPGVNWVDVAGRSLDGWNLYDNRYTGWTGNNVDPFKLGTRIVGINRKDKYIIQRYVINPEAAKIGATSATIHREKPEYPNMDWYSGALNSGEEIQVFKLNKPVTGVISDIRLAEYGATEIKSGVTKDTDNSRFGEPQRLKLTLPATDKPLVIDVKVPYKEESGGVGTGMDWTENGTTYWKSDYYEKASVIKEASPVVSTDGNIVGSYVSDGSLDVTNEFKTFDFKLKKVKDNYNTKAIEGAKFKLTGPGEGGEEREITTGKDGIISFDKLRPGIYKLEEIEPAPGYEKSNVDWTVRITSDGNKYIKVNKKTGVTENTKLVDPAMVDPNTNSTRVIRSAGIGTLLKDRQNSVAYGYNSNLLDTPTLMSMNEFFRGETVALANNGGLEISEESIPTPLRAESDWQKVDPSASTGRRKNIQEKDLASTKITEINKDGKKFRQVFLLKDGDSNSKREVQFHREPEDYGISLNDGGKTTYKIYTVDQKSTLDNPIKIKDVTKACTQTYPTPSGKKQRIKSEIPATIRGPLYVEIETPYNNQYGVGLGVDYIYSRGSGPWGDISSLWIADSYDKEASINKNLVSSYDLNITNGANGTVTAEKTTGIKKDEQVTLNVNPEDRYQLEKLTVAGVDVTNKVADGKYSFTMPASNVAVSATFKAKLYSVWTQTVEHGSITAEPNTNVKAGTKVRITANPKPGYKLEKITYNDNNGDEQTLALDQNNQFTMPAYSMALTAHFVDERPSYEVQVAQNITGGTITANPTSAKAGYTVSLSATPSDGYLLDKFEVKDASNNPVTVNENNQFTMPKSNVTVTAIFKEKPKNVYPISIEPSQNGSVGVAASATNGEEVTVSVNPNDYYELASLTYNGNPITKDAQGNYKFTMPDQPVSIAASFKEKEITGPKEGEIAIPSDGELIKITNKQTGLDLKIFKRDSNSRPLEGGKFTLKKTDENYKTEDTTFTKIDGISGKDGKLVFTDKNGEEQTLALQPGYYVLEETESPSGYKKAQAPWKIHVYEDTTTNQLKAEYQGPDETPNSFVSSDKSLDNSGNTTGIKTTNSGIKYAARMTNINTEGKTYIQRIYIDTRAYKKPVNVQIKPVIKREELDAPGQPPKIGYEGKYGVKTAYRSTYEIKGLADSPTDAKLNDIFKNYTIANDDVSVVNTARWRPFDWGFDEDQLNLDPGVYYIDVEGFYDDNITKEDIGKIEMNIDFKTPRYFWQADGFNQDNTQHFKLGGSYQAGAETFGSVYEKDTYVNGVLKKKGTPTPWGASQPTGQKYPNWLSKEFTDQYNRNWKFGIVAVPNGYEDKKIESVTTSINIRPLYSSTKKTQVGPEGMDIVNDEETYNITFSKHGRDNKDEDINGEDVTKRRLEGAVFKLQEYVINGYKDVEGSTISSAFNGYFGFRGLKPGRYQLIEVKAPEGYKPINGPLLQFTVETIKTNSGKIVDPESGNVVDIKSIIVKFAETDTKTYKLSDLSMVNPDDANKIIKVSSVDSKKISIKDSQIVNPTTNAIVNLNDLIIVTADGHGYPINQIKIVDGSSGYISLEYDKANGVYQYVPEKSTSEKDGKLVDFVTSATAKNMGKIINEKPGKGEITVKKVDQKGKEIKATDQLPGAKFLLTNKSTGAKEEGTVGTDGTLKFTKLQIGNYRLEEIKSPDGYINNKQVWNFTVGGEGLDPYAGEAPQRRDDVSSSIKITESKLSVLNPESKKEGLLSDKQKEMHPHFGEVFEFANKYTIDSNLKINPGDYFVLKLSKNIDLHGIMETNISNLDIIADGVGTIAKADYDRKEGTITYTFTDYAKTYNLTEFSNKLKAYINLNKVPKAGSQSIERGVVGHDMIKNNIEVVYDSMTAREKYQANDGNWYEMKQNYLNLGSKIIKFNPDTGEFVHYYYVNRDRSNTPRSRFYYSSDQDIENMNIEYYRLDGSANLDKLMPLSFGVNEDDSRLPEPVRIRSRSKLYSGEEESFTFPGGLDSNSTYLVKVTGKVAGKDKSSYVAHGMLKMTDYTGRYVTRWDKQYFFKNEAAAKADLNIQAVNPENIIKFKKVDQDGNPLADAKFQLQYKNKEGQWVADTSRDKTTGADGVFEYTKLKPGSYKVIEISAPEGYKKAEDPVAVFDVDENGRIIRKDNKTPVGGTSEDSSNNEEEHGIKPIEIVNKKEQKISFVKVDASDKKRLAGAEFEVWYKKDKSEEKYSNTALKLYEKTSGGKTERLVLKDGETAPEGYTEVKHFTTGEDGKIEFTFYENGYYALKETKAPKGYIAPKDFVKEFVVKDGKVQKEKYKTSMDVNKTKSRFYANGMHDVYNTDITMKINPDHEKINYTKDNSKITLSGLPLNNEYYENNIDTKKGITINARLVNSSGRSSAKTYTLDLNKNYTNGKGEITIDLYDLVKELENKTGDSFESENTIELSMSPTLALSTTLDINSRIEIGDGKYKISEDRTFNIGTKGDEKVDHSYSFTTKGSIDLSKPIEIENKKGEYPLTGAMGIIGFLVAGAVIMTTAYYKYRRKRRESALS